MDISRGNWQDTLLLRIFQSTSMEQLYQPQGIVVFEHRSVVVLLPPSWWKLKFWTVRQELLVRVEII